MLPTEVEIVSYDPAWPALYEREAERLRRALSHVPFRVDHVGSTAVPGLAAKPIVDVLGGRPAGSDPRPYVDAIVALGWVHRGENGIPGRDYFRLGDPVRTHHLHLFVEGAPAWREHLAFRDTLRERPALAREYERLKRALAARHVGDRGAYTGAKAAFIAAVLRVAGTDAPAGPRVRAKAICVVRRGAEVLVGEAHDAAKGETFYGPPGGGVEFGEYAEAALRREMREELGAELLDVRLLGTLENVFVYDGRPGHEIAFVFEARLADESLYRGTTIEGTEGGRAFVVEWRPLATFAPGGPPLYPTGLYELLTR